MPVDLSVGLFDIVHRLLATISSSSSTCSMESPDAQQPESKASREGSRALH